MEGLMEGLQVDHGRCVQCGQCIISCNRRILSADGSGFPFLPDENYEQCIACGHCSAVCPADALIAPKCGGEKAVPFPAAPDLDSDTAKKFLLSCRSMRLFKQETVKKDAILDLLDVARKAPSAGNLQTISWKILNGKEKTREFTALTMEWFDKELRHNPEFSARYNIDNMLERHRNGDDPILRGACNAVIAVTDNTAVWGAVDGAIAITYFCLAAYGMNVGSCWCGFGMRALQAYQPLRDLVGLDDSQTAHGMAFFGYPELEYHALPPRKPLRADWVE